MSSSKRIASQEMDFIRENFREMTNAELSDALGISPNNVSNRIFRLGLKRDPCDLAVIKAREGREENVSQHAQKGGLVRRTYCEEDARREHLQNKTPKELRILYAKYIYGQGASYPIDQVPGTLKVEAGLSDFKEGKCLNEIVEELARSWGSFNRK